MFGFSRGAFTAKFLARMINTVGLLCKGNEEMVPFAYRLYQRHLTGEVEDFKKKNGKPSKKHRKTVQQDTPPPTPPLSASFDETQPLLQPNGEDEGAGPHHEHNYQVASDELTAFSDTFCRREEVFHCGSKEESNIKVYFLGLWDCVNSVAVLERKAPVPLTVKGTARHVRHAVAIDERRVKFKAALFAQDIQKSNDHDHEDIQEVWFPGCHGDVGGGWPTSDKVDFEKANKMTIWQRIVKIFRSRKSKPKSKALCSGRLQLSDIPLAWMIHEIDLVDKAAKNDAEKIQWRDNKCEFEERFGRKHEQAWRGVIHDSLTFGRGTGFFTVLLWKLMGKHALKCFIICSLVAHWGSKY